MEICPGHPLDPGMLDRARREFDLMGKYGFLDAANRIAGMAKELITDPYEILGPGSPEAQAYADAIRAREWDRANTICLDRFRIVNPGEYRKTLYMECVARWFTSALACEVSRAETLHRWMDFVELPSYRKGTFESRKKEGKEPSGCKLFSLGPNGYARDRPVHLTVLVDDAVRGALRPAAYTAVPWSVPAADERIDSRKHLSFAGETECRLPDGARVPGGARIVVKRRVLDADPDSARYYAVLESLKDVAEIRFT